MDTIAECCPVAGGDPMGDPVNVSPDTRFDEPKEDDDEQGNP